MRYPYKNNLFLWIILSFSLTSAQAQTSAFFEDFELWTGASSCPQGWICDVNPGCTSLASCYWEKNDDFGTIAQPSLKGCDSTGFYARCNSSELSAGEFPVMNSPLIDLSGYNVSTPGEVTFCYINGSTNSLDPDGIRVSFSPDGGGVWIQQILDANVYNTWTRITLAIDTFYYTDQFQIKFEGFGSSSTMDIGIDDVEVKMYGVPCNSSTSTISSHGPFFFCKNSEFLDVEFTESGNSSGLYAFLVTDDSEILVEVVSGNAFNFQELPLGAYRVYGISYTGTLNGSIGHPLSNLSASVCQQISDNHLAFEVTKFNAQTEITSNYNGAHISINGAMDGSVSVSVPVGSGTYGYTWNTIPPQYSTTLQGLGAGSYTVTVIDSITGCTTQQTANLIEPDVLDVTFNEVAGLTNGTINCAGDTTGILQAQGTGGVGPFNYLWHTAPLQTQAILEDVKVGTYWVTVTDANGAQTIDSISISERLPLTATADAVSPACGAENDGTIDLSVTGGTAPYNYQWTDGQTVSSISQLGKGIYRCTITDDLGCVIEIDARLTQPEPLLMTLDGTAPKCFDGEDGIITTDVRGGVAPYTYSWSHGSTESNQFDLSSGAYVVEVTDAQGCTISEEIELARADSIAIFVTTTPDNGTGLGTATVEVLGGTTPYTYTWTNGSEDAQADNLQVGLYGVFVEDANGCMADQEVEITAKDKLDCLEVHTGFSPNGDGVNESWFIPCIEFFPENEIAIFNRWGQKLYAAENYDNSWGGTSNGKPLPDGTYYYTVKLNSESDKRFFKGTVTIIR